MLERVAGRSWGPGDDLLGGCEEDPATADLARTLRQQLSGSTALPVTVTVPCEERPGGCDVHLSPRLAEDGSVEGALVAVTATPDLVLSANGSGCGSWASRGWWPR